MSGLTLTRRALLKSLGLGAAASVPVFRRGLALAQTPPGAIPKRFIAYVHFCGTQPWNWFPAGTAADQPLTGPLPRLLEPLEPFRSKILLFKGLRLSASRTPAGSHSRGMSTVLTGIETVEDGSVALHSAGGGPSVDQHIAQAIGAATRFPSLQFGIQNRYGRLVYRDRLEGLPTMQDPWAIYTRLFSGMMPGGPSPEELEQLRRRRRSVLDHAAREITTLMPLVGAPDRPRLEANLESIRQLERRLDVAAGASCQPPTMPAQVDPQSPENIPIVAPLQIELMAAAMACDLTRVETLHWAKGTTTMTFPWMGFTDTHHDLSHAGDSNTVAQEKYYRINRFLSEHFALLLTRLDAIPERDGRSLLDHSVVLWGTENGKGNSHTLDNIPFLVAGGAGAMRAGRYLQYPTQIPHNRLLLSICNAVGVPTTTFGNPEYCVGGPLPNLA